MINHKLGGLNDGLSRIAGGCGFCTRGSDPEMPYDRSRSVSDSRYISRSEFRNKMELDGHET